MTKHPKNINSNIQIDTYRFIDIFYIYIYGYVSAGEMRVRPEKSPLCPLQQAPGEPDGPVRGGGGRTVRGLLLSIHTVRQGGVDSSK